MGPEAFFHFIPLQLTRVSGARVAGRCATGACCNKALASWANSWERLLIGTSSDGIMIIQNHCIRAETREVPDEGKGAVGVGWGGLPGGEGISLAVA